MKKLLICLLISLFCSNVSYPFHLNQIAHAQQKPIPPYAKWSKVALEKTKAKYPNAKIVDYLHIGRRSGQSTSTERFKFWLKENQKEFGVFVNIEFNNQTGQVVNVTFQETTR
ncbi:YqzG/YhdC family protein [Neobacillus niacini]|uniref:YqzG/YhdC family protein n=1 Tax=Neobacillus niacini TaxID=86668 RepID=UPI002FFF8825